MSAFSLLGEIIAHGGKVAAEHYRYTSGFTALMRHGFVVDAGVVASVVCDACEDLHAASVVFENESYGHHCPDFGFVACARDEVQAVAPNVGQLVKCLGDALECRKQKSSAVHEKTWRVGSYDAGKAEVMVYLHPRLSVEEDTQALGTALARETRALWCLIVTGQGTLERAGARAVRLAELAELDGETGIVRILMDLSTLLDLPRASVGGRPSEYAIPLSKIISERNQTGAALKGLNAETRAVLSEYAARHPNKQTPSLATVKRHLTKSDAGS